MRLPRHLLESPFFVFSNETELVQALRDEVDDEEIAELRRLVALGLPPITSEKALAAMLGVNPGLVWAFVNNHRKYYNKFDIKKGSGLRTIVAPRVALKTVQKWLSFHMLMHYKRSPIVFGFVCGFSHIDAALMHCGADWIFECDIQNFFPSTPVRIVRSVFERIGYRYDQADLLSRLCSFGGYLAQGAPTSPCISNFALEEVDAQLQDFAGRRKITVTRYADDIVFSGKGEVEPGLQEFVTHLFDSTPWKINDRKTLLQKRPSRLKVHGLLVDQDRPRLTKGYRNKIRAYTHIIASKNINERDRKKLLGHINYAEQIVRRNKF